MNLVGFNHATVGWSIFIGAKPGEQFLKCEDINDECSIMYTLCETHYLLSFSFKHFLEKIGGKTKICVLH